eukprot:11218412-Lingulodinium_polyedra.AAC.1
MARGGASTTSTCAFLGFPLPGEFNYSLMVSLGKVLVDAVAVVSIPAPGDARPRGLSNADAEIVAKAVSWPLKE